MWVAAIGTVGTLFLALYQVDCERKRRIAERHEEHARLISAWIGRGAKDKNRTDFYLANGSHIHNVAHGLPADAQCQPYLVS